MTKQDIKMIPFGQIDPSKLNPRKVFDPEAIESIAASIGVWGIEQNLVVRPSPKDKKRFELVAGERRWRAVQLLIANRTWDPGDPLPCRLIECDDAGLIEASLSENLQREGLHPLDEAEGYATLVEAGRSIAEIAAGVPFTKRHVELRLALANNLQIGVKNNFRADKITLAQARVLAAYAPPKRQPGVLKRILAGDHGYQTPDNLKEQLLRESVPLGFEIFDPTLYKGGWIEDPDDPDARRYADVEAFVKLQEAAIVEREAKLKETYGWVEVHRAQWFDDWKFGHSADKDKKKAGAVILVRADHSVKIYNDLLKQANSREAARGSKRGGPKTAAPASDDPRRSLPTKAGLHLAKVQKTHALRAALLEAGPQKAERLACLALLGQTDEIRLSRASGRDRPGDRVATPQVDTVIKDKTHGFKGLGGRIGGAAGLLEALLFLDDKSIGELFTALVAQTLGSYPGDGELGDSDTIALLASDIGADVSQHWSLDDDYLAACKKRELLEIALSLGVTQPSAKKGWPRPISEVQKLPLAGLRTLILAYVKDHPEAKMSFLPFPFHFGTPKTLLAKIAAAAPKSEAKAKPKAKPKPKAKAEATAKPKAQAKPKPKAKKKRAAARRVSRGIRQL